MSKNHVAALAAGLLLPLAASAQSSVTLFGVVETGVQRLTNVNATGGSALSLASGNYAASRWGVRGQEDLGGGYGAFFRLEAGFNADDGSNASPVSFFNRYSHVGISAPWGTVTTGRTGSVQFDKTAFYDPLYFSNYSHVSLSLPVAYLKVNNAVKYESPSIAGFNGELMVGFGQEAANNTRAGRYMGAALEYVSGGLSTRVYREEVRGNAGPPDQSGLADKRTSIAAAYKSGAWHLFANVIRVSGDLKLSPPGTIYTLAAAWQVDGLWRLTLEPTVYKQSGKPSTTLVDALVEYSLSKRTTLFAAAAQINNRGGTQNGVVFGQQMAAPNLSQSGLTLGIAHRF